MEDWLAARSRATPNALALVIGSEQWRYKQLNELVTVVALHLRREVEPGQRIAVLLANGLEFVCLIHAAARVGAVLVPLNSRLTPGELAWQIERANSSLLISSVDLAGGLDFVAADSLLEPQTTSESASFPPFDIENLQAVVYTSGTSGRPKGALLTFSNHFYSANGSAYRLGLDRGDRWLCCLPLYHVGGMAIVLRSCLYGTAVDLHDGFDVSAISAGLDVGQITVISLVPTMLRRLLSFRNGRHWPGSLRHVLLGGAAAAKDLLAACQSLEIPVSITYGLTEAASQVATMTPDEALQKPGSVGRPLLFTRIAIVSAEGRAIAAGEIGEIVVKGPTVMSGYDGDEASTALALRDGWLHTGDMGFLDEDGDLWVLQRRDDVVISGGENVYPAEVESVLGQHPQVSEVCVFGIDDTEWGQKVAAAVSLKGKEEVSPQELVAFCRESLAGYKLPREIFILESLPKNAAGKILRRVVAETCSARP